MSSQIASRATYILVFHFALVSPTYIGGGGSDGVGGPSVVSQSLVLRVGHPSILVFRFSITGGLVT